MPRPRNQKIFFGIFNLELLSRSAVKKVSTRGLENTKSKKKEIRGGYGKQNF
jgi:hypothetical protein